MTNDKVLKLEPEDEAVVRALMKLVKWVEAEKVKPEMKSGDNVLPLPEKDTPPLLEKDNVSSLPEKDTMSPPLPLPEKDNMPPPPLPEKEETKYQDDVLVEKETKREEAGAATVNKELE